MKSGKPKKTLLLVGQCGSAAYLRREIVKLGLIPLHIPSRELSAIDRNSLGKSIAGTYSLDESGKIQEQRLGRELGLKHLPLHILRLSRDKYLMRKKLAENPETFLPHSFIPNTSIQLQAPLPFPFIVKPNYGYASAGVQKVSSAIAFETAVRTIRRLNSLVFSKYAHGAMGVLCEQYIDGPEISVDSITVRGRTRIFGICHRKFAGKENFQDFAYFLDPIKMGKRMREIEGLITGTLRVVRYTDGPSHIELKKCKDTGRWIILDLAFRVGGTGHIGKLIEETTGIPYNRLAIRSWLENLSEKDLLSIKSTKSNFGLVFVPYAGNGGVIREYPGKRLLRGNPAIKYSIFPQKIGKRFVPYPNGADYLGVILGVEKSKKQLDRLYHDLKSKIWVKYA